MINHVKLYLLTGIAFFAMDLAWIGLAANPMYQKHIAHLLAPKPKLGIAGVFYALYLAFVLILVVLPAVRAGDARQALVMGAVLGLAAYGTYDLTNWSVMRDWPWFLSVADWVWGTFLTATTSVLGFHIANWLGVK